MARSAGNIVHLTPKLTQADVSIAWATYRGLRLAEKADPSLRDEPNHCKAVAIAEERFERVFDEWVRG